MTTFDNILEEAGPFGRCQKRIFALLCLVSLPFAGVYVGIVFQGFTPDHWCRVPAVLIFLKIMSLIVINCNYCFVFSVQDGWEYDYEGRNSFVTEFDLVCSDGWLVDMFQSTLNVGFLIGSFAFGYLADRFGRRLSFLVSNVINVTSGMVVALAPNYISILVFRGVFGFAVKGGWMTCYVLMTEVVGKEYRRTVGILFQMLFSVGNLILPLLAYFITDWRWMQMYFPSSIPVYSRLVPESPRWLLSQNKASTALQITEALAKENRQKLSVPDLETLTEEGGDSPSASLLDLVRTPNMRKHTFIFMFNWFTSAVVYQGLIMRVGIAGGNVYLDFFISGLVEFPAAFLILFTIERIGRRLPFATANIIAGVSCLITAFIPESLFWFKTVVACVGRLGITMAFEMVVFVNTELYPTFVRNLGLSVCSTLCDVGGIVSPFLLYRLANIWLELPLIIFGAVAIVAGGLVLLLPETKGVPLPETIDDIEFPNREQSGFVIIYNGINLQSAKFKNIKNINIQWCQTHFSTI
uniref:Solute carrier family 22 member 3 n=1 Tax=Sphaeramia orbicularis TaxID=375764 RepID=A0A673BYQ7_9TELE